MLSYLLFTLLDVSSTILAVLSCLLYLANRRPENYTSETTWYWRYNAELRVHVVIMLAVSEMVAKSRKTDVAPTTTITLTQRCVYLNADWL